MPDSSPKERIVGILASIPGVRRAVEVPDELRRRVAELEAEHERASVLPVRNLGVRQLAGRSECFVLLKDSSFRSPGIPTVYLVEENAPEDAPHVLVVDGRRYAVVGEEVVAGRSASGEPVIPLERSFVIFPERRRGRQVPCFFVLPPVRFPELDGPASALGICDVVSVSPSLAADALLREAFGFPLSNELATLLVGFNRAPGKNPASSS